MGIVTNSSGSKKDLNVELNLMPVFDILAVCICFLLMTVVWIQVGIIKAGNSVGSESSAPNSAAKNLLFVRINEDRTISVSAGQSAESVKTMPPVKAVSGLIDISRFSKLVATQKNTDTAVILPDASVSYDEVIRVMDALRSTGFSNVGLSPI
jgi:biopolymer transport protein ExbD